MTNFKSLMAAAILSLTSALALAGETTLGDLVIKDPWTRATPPNAMAGGGFLTITNTGGADDTLVSAASPVAGRVELHEMAVVDGVMKMREMQGGIPVPAGQTVALEPGGLHVMFMDLKEPLTEGGMAAVTLTFEKAGSVDIEMPIAKIGAKGMDQGGHGHGHMPMKSPN
ncbi:copper chaperone PCu(A)C [Polymorphum gilvum]|uniref:Nuclear export factor GLE1 n=1 Tax=Polymorphum gilvum (strain LMG 25793 / CGMCC 1.9160 / SL003B-26A1) TaxID=991905 RepID=F2IYB2_POLGS|nr:copper chaperone PCu(A)C [Polymorphum gilvum]ADZ71724.1 Nuclear export factor GLE1 [Polymorphum gilvum SL003B-26A1]